jgi:hypothetical protein
MGLKNLLKYILPLSEYDLRSSQNSQHPICDILASSCASLFCTLNAVLMVIPKSLEQLLPLYL